MMEATTAMVKREATEQAVMPVQNMGEAMSLGEAFERSGMFGCSQQGQGVVLVLTCMSERISPLQFKRTYHLIDGNPCMRADAMLAKFQSLGGKYKIHEFSTNRAAANFAYGENAMDMEVTMAQAQAAGWPFKKDGKSVKDNWARTPDAMLWARLVSKAVRVLAPGVNAGVYTPEEVQDFDAPVPRKDEPQAAGMSAAKTVKASAKPATAMAATAEVVTQAQAEVSSGKPADAVIDVKAKPVTEVATSVATAEAVVDLDVAPIGKIAGQKWADQDVDTLLVVMGVKRPEITKDHKARIMEVLATRQGMSEAQEKKMADFVAEMKGV